MSEEFDMEAGLANMAEQMGFDEPDSEEFDDDEIPETEETEEAEEAPTVEEEPETVGEKRAAPASWQKEKHEIWDKIPDEAKDYVELREKQMLDGIEQYKQGYKWAEHIAKTIEPFRDVLQQNNVDESTAITNLFSHHRALTEGPIEQRQQAFVTLGQSLGLIPAEGQKQIDPVQQQINERLARIERMDQQRQQEVQQQSYNKTLNEVEIFASKPENIYFDELSDDIIMLINAGMDLQTAYDKAVWANPITRAKEQAKVVEAQLAEKLNKTKNEAQKSKNATKANVRTTAKNNIPKQPLGSWQDTMRETLQELKNSGRY